VPIQWVYSSRKQISFEITEKISMTNEDSGQRKSGRNMPMTWEISLTQRIWMQYIPFQTSLTKALNCISEMTLISLTHAQDCLIYLSVLRDQSVFNFCAIPQVMAIATLALVYRNPLVFQRNIKIRRGEMALVTP
jgi:hypothetical protein